MRAAGWILGAAALAVLAGCAEKTPEQESYRDDCEIEGRYYFVSHPWACIREGGRSVEAKVFFDNHGHEVRAVGKDGEGRSVGLTPLPQS